MVETTSVETFARATVTEISATDVLDRGRQRGIVGAKPDGHESDGGSIFADFGQPLKSRQLA